LLTYSIALGVCLAGKSSQQNLVSELGSKKSFGQKLEEKEEDKLKEKSWPAQAAT
jgi:hypothetical protein